MPALGPTALSIVGEIRFFSDGQQPLVRVDTISVDVLDGWTIFGSSVYSKLNPMLELANSGAAHLQNID